MTSLTVENRERLDVFLRAHGYQQWRVAILLRCGAIYLNRTKGKEESRFLNSNDHTRGKPFYLQQGDTLVIKESLSDRCTKQFAAIPAMEYRDYAYAPGQTRYEQAMRQLFSLRRSDRRAETILLSHASYRSLTDFVAALQRSEHITNPIRDLLVASHAHPDGVLFIELNTAIAREITYEDLEVAIKNKTIQLPSTLAEPRPVDKQGNAQPFRLHIKGCRIGRARPFLALLKGAFNGELNQVTAPKHFHCVGRPRHATGLMEYLSYGFTITRPQRFQNRNQLIQAFSEQQQSPDFQQIDGRKVPWQDWVPQQANINQSHTFPVQVILPIMNQPHNIRVTFRFEACEFFPQRQSIKMQSDPVNDADRRRAIQNKLVNQFPYFREEHNFPMFVRLGYSSMDEFMNGWNWRIQWDSAESSLTFHPIRYTYTVQRPIVDPGTNRLLLNYYPFRLNDQPIILLREDDNRFFATV